MKIRYENGEQYFHKLHTFFNASIAITLLPMALLILQRQAAVLQPLVIESTIKWIIVGVLIISPSALLILSHRKFGVAKIESATKEKLREKLDSYFHSSLKKYFEFLLSAACFVVGMYITANNLFIVGYIVNLIFLSLGRPTLTAFIEDLKLSKEDKTILLEKRPID